MLKNFKHRVTGIINTKVSHYICTIIALFTHNQFFTIVTVLNT